MQRMNPNKKVTPRKAGGNDKEEALQRAETYAKSMYMSKKFN